MRVRLSVVWVGYDHAKRREGQLELVLWLVSLLESLLKAENMTPSMLRHRRRPTKLIDPYRTILKLM